MNWCKSVNRLCQHAEYYTGYCTMDGCTEVKGTFYTLTGSADGVRLTETVKVTDETLEALQNDKTMEVIRQAIEDEVNRQFEKRLKRLLNGEDEGK